MIAMLTDSAATWLADTFIYTGVLIALVLVLRRPVTRHFGPQIAYALWALPFLRLLLPPLVLPASFAPTGTTPVALPAEAGAGEWIAVAETPAMTTAGGADVIAPVAATVDWLALAGMVALPLWLGGAALFLGWRIHAYHRMRAELLADARPVGEVGRVRLVESPLVGAPVAFGVVDKVVAMPLFFMAQHDRRGRDLAIAHELAHHRGHDLLANFAAQALLALHWFNPMAWMGWRAMRRDQEAACDARVLSGRCREDRIRYAALIANIAAGPKALALPGLAAPMACPVLGEASVIHRLRSISMSEISPRRRWIGRTMVAAGALALPLTASISYAASEDAQTTTETVTHTQKRMVIVDHEGGADPADASLFTHVVQRDDGTQVILKTDRQLTDAEAMERVERAIASLPDMPEPPAPPAAIAGVAPPAPPAPPAPHAGQAGEVRHFVVRRDGDGTPQVERRVVVRTPDGQFDEEAFEAEMERMGAELERSLAEGERVRAEAVHRIALAEAGRDGSRVNVVTRCNGRGPTSTETAADGSQTVYICEAEVQATALTALKSARAAVAGAQMPEYARLEALREIDAEIARMSRGN